MLGAGTLRVEEGAVEVRREDRSRTIEVRANTTEDMALAEAVALLEGWAAELGIQRPYAFTRGGQAESMAEAMVDIVFALVLGMLSIYMILASLFNSLTHPFVIMISAPLSFIGGFLALKVGGLSFDIMGAMGLLVLMGLVMKNGILLVDYTNQLRAQGMPRREALLEAGPVRMRPVLMTSGALICGLLPMALSTATGSEFRAPMAVMVIGGIATSTPLTLLILPVVYTLVDGTADAMLRGLRKLRGRSEPEPQPSAVAGGR